MIGKVMLDKEKIINRKSTKKQKIANSQKRKTEKLFYAN